MNKYFAKGKQKQGIGTGPAKGDVTGQRGSISSDTPQRTASWPGLPGPAQPRGRSNGAPTTGHMGPFRHKSEGI